MALVLKDRVKETTTSTGTGTINLAGAASGFQTFVAGVGSTNTTYYAIEDANGTAWEVGLGTVTDASPDTLSRTIILDNSNGDTDPITLSTGTHTVFGTYPAGKAVYLDATGVLSHAVTLTADVTGTLPAANGGTGLTSTSTLLNSNVTPTSLSLVIGTDVQGYDADLSAIAALSSADGNFIVGSPSGWVAESGATARASLGVDATGTDNSTNVTLVTTSHDYLSISTQAITLGIIDISDDTNLVAGTGITLTGDTLSVDASQTQVTAVGTIATGTWQGTAIAQAYIANDAINGDKIADDVVDSEHYVAGSIDEEHLNVTNSPTDNYILSYDSASGGFTWVASGGGGEANEYSFKTISVSGQDDVVADTTTDTLTLAAGSNVTITTTTASDTVTIAATDTNTMGSGFTVSATTDTTATTITQGDDLFFAAGTGITCETTADGTVTISSTVTDTNTQLTQEQVEDYVGGMVAGNTETGIAVTYEDGDGTLDFVVSDTTVAGDSGSTGITPGATLTIAGGSNVTTSMSGDTLTITATDTNTMGSGFTVSATTDSNATTITQGDDLMFAAGTGITCETTADGTVTISCTVTDTNTTYTKASFDVDHLFTLVGASADTDEHLSTFTGSTIADNQTIKQALQALETAVETKGTGTVDVTGTPTAGHVAIWSDADTITFDSAKLFWDTSSDELGVGTSSPGSTLHVSGSVQFKTYTVGDTGDADWSSNIHELHDATKGANHYILCDTGNTNRTVELPDASSALAGRTYVIKKIDSGTGTVTIQPDDNDGTDGYLDRDNATVDDGTNILWVQFDTISCTCAEGYTDGQYEWHIVHEKVAPHNAKIRMEGNSGNIANDTDTAIAYDTLDYAVGCGTTLTGSDRKITINRKGKYSVKVQLRMNNTFDNGERADIKLYKNGTHINTGSTIYSPATNKYVYGWLDNSFELDVDDYLTVKINHWQGENAQIFNKYYDNTTTAFDPILVVEEIK